jgi:glycosyltransferase involved in cell wall biosynthesis
MKILIIMSGFLPGRKFGGPPVSTDNFCTLMKESADCYILTHNHDMGETIPYSGISEGWNERGNAKVKYVCNLEYNSDTFESTILELRPDYVYLQGLFQECVFPCLKLAKRHQLKVVLAPRGELCAGAFQKKYKKIPYIAALRMMRLLDNVVFQSTSDEETEVICKYLGVPVDRVHLLSNIPSIPQNLPKRNEKIAGDGKFVFISRILWKKNLLNAIKFFSEAKGNVTFDIYGPKEDENYWKECENAIKELPANIVVSYKGVLSHDGIHKTFCQYDAFLFPTLSENYGHVIAEALVSNCVPIISDQTPWTDMNGARAGWALPLTDENGFKEAIQQIIDMDDVAIQTKRKNIEEYLNRKLKLDELKKEYLKVFK